MPTTSRLPLRLLALGYLAAILLVTGVKLARPSLARRMWDQGRYQFIPFAVTVAAIVPTDLLIGVKDLAGNARGAQIARTVVLSAETSAKRGGTWTKKSSTAYLGGKALGATAKNRKLTWTFTGRSAALYTETYGNRAIRAITGWPVEIPPSTPPGVAEMTAPNLGEKPNRIATSAAT